ncbi:MAG: hypothetical protein ACI9PN_002185, partial [Candidatus Azotimanducaceae bacterium]
QKALLIEKQHRRNCVVMLDNSSKASDVAQMGTLQR